MNEETTVALWDANMEHWSRLQVTVSLGNFSLLQKLAADHWAYSLKLFSCSAVTPSWCCQTHKTVRWESAIPGLPCLLELGAPRARDASERQVRRRPFMVACSGARRVDV
jgi:hypothetical protein